MLGRTAERDKAVAGMYGVEIESRVGIVDGRCDPISDNDIVVAPGRDNRNDPGLVVPLESNSKVLVTTEPPLGA